MAVTDVIANNLAAAFLSGPWSSGGLRRRGAQALGRRERWLAALTRRVMGRFPQAPPEEELVAALVNDAAFAAVRARAARVGETLRSRLFWVMPKMGASPWPVPPLATTGALAEWLDLTPGQLDWYADVRGWEARHPDGPLRHYTYRWLAGRRGKRRLLEQPRPRLKHLQRKILHDILDHIPPHDAAHSYRRGRDVVTYAAPHAGGASWCDSTCATSSRRCAPRGCGRSFVRPATQRRWRARWPASAPTSCRRMSAPRLSASEGRTCRRAHRRRRRCG